jgi:hypothetical protein
MTDKTDDRISAIFSDLWENHYQMLVDDSAPSAEEIAKEAIRQLIREEQLKARLVELDLFEQAINKKYNMYGFKLSRLSDLEERLAALRQEKQDKV